MLHPHTELRFVSPEIGYGIFATEDIPKGTITWVKDQLDRVFSPEEVSKLSPPNYENLMKYTYRDKNGNYFFCWDLTRFINHNHDANSMLTSLGFEIALRDIKKGEELTNDYGTLNIIEPFQCANGPLAERDYVRPDDLTRYYQKWDQLIEAAIKFVDSVPQPLMKFIGDEQTEKLSHILQMKMELPSIKTNYFEQQS
jgi:hypothetical protein